MVLGASTDTVAKQAKFRKKYALPFTLLADVDHALADACGVWGLKHFMGKSYHGVLRTTFIFGPDGVLRRVFEKVTPLGHAGDVASALEALQRG